MAELLQLKVDVLLCPNLPAINAAKQATKAIPIVMVSNVDPVELGIVDSFSHPGGNITGLTRLTRDLSGKRLELLREALPRLSRVGILLDVSSPESAAFSLKEYEAEARGLKITIQPLQVRSPNADFDATFEAVAKKRRQRAHYDS